MGRVWSQMRPGPVSRREEQAVAAKDEVLDAADHGDLKRHAGLECADVAGMDEQGLARLQVADDHFAGKFEPCGALAADFLKQEAVAAEDARAERLLEPDADGE